jgi:nicotinamide-nucleotide amidase
MNAEILAVGTELLMGQIANTNAQYISSRLPDAGIDVYHHSVVGDNPERLKESILIALSRADIVITTGGLGPTQDDLTKETIASLLNRKLVLDEESLQKMKCFFERIKRPMTCNNVKQAYIPENSIIIRNKNGTAPGCIIEENGKTIVMLPGPPSEMKPMFDDDVMPYFMKKTNVYLESKFLRIFGLGESAMEDMILDLVDKQTNPTIAPYAKEGEITLRITASYEKGKEKKDLITPVVEEIRRRLGDSVFCDENKNMEDVVGQLLIDKCLKISVAESCTGGLVAAKLTAVPGISKVLDRCIVSYSNRSKVEELKVKQETLDRFGAVSRETAIEMAEGIRMVSGSDFGLSITGIAGPDGGTDEKPVGLVYIALAFNGGTDYKELRLWGERNRIRNMASLHALNLVRKKITD